MNATGRDVGLNRALQATKHPVFMGDSVELAQGLELFSCNARSHPFGSKSFGLSVQRNDVTEPDDFWHEQYLLITEGKKRVLISGCSHKGILNLSAWFLSDVLVGGFHFMKLDPTADGLAALDRAARELSRHKMIYYTCHCTGTAQYKYLKTKMNQQLHYTSCGQTLEL